MKLDIDYLEHIGGTYCLSLLPIIYCDYYKDRERRLGIQWSLLRYKVFIEIKWRK